MQTKYWILILLLVVGLLLIYNKQENVSGTDVSGTLINSALLAGGMGCTDNNQCMSNICKSSGKCKCTQNNHCRTNNCDINSGNCI